jgi:mannose-1-phosphate guanylyltransferase
MGVKPTYPSTGFGYIQMGKKVGKSKGLFELNQFVEKPNKPTAQKYFKSGKYLWNTGYLTGTIKTFEREIKNHSPRLWNDYRKLKDVHLAISRKRVYLDFISEPIDTALSEHVPDALVVSGDFDWADVGSFHDLHDVSQQDKTGNHIAGENVELEDVSDSYVRNESNIPVAVIGVDKVAVIATENGILVTSKDKAQKVGDISKRLQQEKKGFKWLGKLSDLT